MTTTMTTATQWSDERLAGQYLQEIRQKFEAENAAHRAQDQADIDRARRNDPERWADLVAREPHMDQPRDGGYWEIYQASDIQVDGNDVRIVLPMGWAIDADLIRMFDGTSVAWTAPTLCAELIEGGARIVVELILVDYWDDDRQAAWLVRTTTPPVDPSTADRAPPFSTATLVDDDDHHHGPSECSVCGAGPGERHVFLSHYTNAARG